MDDNRPKVDPDREEPEGGPPIAGRWLIGAGSALVLVILFLTGGSGPAPPPTSSTTSTTLTRPTVSVTTTVPPTTSTTVAFETSLGPALSDSMLEWNPVEGLTDATTIDGLVEWRADYWIAGGTQDGPALWRSVDGRGWEGAGSIPTPSTHRVADMTVWNDRLVVAASPGPWSTTGSGAVLAYDGRNWTEYVLPSGDPGRPDAHPQELVPVGNRLVVHGTAWPEVPDLLPHLEPRLRELVESGRAISYQSGQGIHVVLVPSGIEVARIPNDETGLPPPSDLGGIALAWVGGDLADLAVDSSFPRPVAPLPDGRLVGTPNFGLAVSEDGETWEETGQHPGRVEALTPWRGGIIVTLVESAPVYWAPGGGTSSLLPPNLWEDVTFSPPALTGSWGIGVALYHNPDVTTRVESEEVVIPLDEGDLHFGSGSLRLVRDGEPVWTDTVFEVRAKIDASGDVRLGPEPDAVTIELDALEEAAATVRVGVPMRVDVLHSPHGGIWSSTPWADVIGSESQGSARLFAIDDFLMAVDSKVGWSGEGTVETVTIGTLATGG